MSIILSSIQQSLALVCSQARLWLNYESNFFYVGKSEPDLPTRRSYLYSLWDQVGVVLSITVFFLYLSLLRTEPGTCGGNRQIKHWHSLLSIDIWEEGIQSSNILKSRRTFEHTGSDFQNSTIYNFSLLFSIVIFFLIKVLLVQSLCMVISSSCLTSHLKRLMTGMLLVYNQRLVLSLLTHPLPPGRRTG